MARAFAGRSAPTVEQPAPVRNTEATSRQSSWQSKSEADKQYAEAEKQNQKEAFEKRLAEKGVQEEMDAATALTFAKDLIAAKKTYAAAERLKKLIKDYPHTKAGREAAELLKRL